MAEILAIGTDGSSSNDFTVVAGLTATVMLKNASGTKVESGARVWLMIKSSGGEYFRVREMNVKNTSMAIVSPGTYRVSRVATGVSVGVDLYS